MPSHNAVLDVLAGGLVRMEDGGHVTHDPTSSHTNKSKGYGPGDQPVDSQWRAALRSYLAGTAGLPGDLEGLVRQGINWARSTSNGQQIDPTPVLPTTDFYKDWLPGKQEGSAPLADLASMAGGVGMLKGIRSVESLGKAIAHAAPGPVAGGKLAQLGVIRASGDNNFLKGSVENALKGLKRGNPEAMRDELAVLRGMNGELPRYANADRDILKTESLNKFVEGPLTRYVKQQMATPDDPVRALAEQGVLHVSPASLVRNGGDPQGFAFRNAAVREHFGFDPQGVGKSDDAKLWEDASDNALTWASAKGWADDAPTLANNRWLLDTPADKRIFSGGKNLPDNLGFTHLTDELRNALNPDSGLPRNLLLTPEKLQNMGMEKAVRHVAAINDWRAAQVAEANAQRANNAATVLHKEYPHTPETPNPKGLRWQELVIPKAPEGYVQEGAAWRHPTDTKKPWFYPEDAFKEAVKYEGDTMGHSVGGYASEGGYGLGGLDAIRTGKARVYSLRDAKGQPHVTIEVGTKVQDPMFEAPREVQDQISRQAHQEARARGLNPESDDYMDAVLGRQQELSELWNATQPVEPRITQVKGKGNRKPIDDYIPFVQDFVKSGKWSDVGDLANTGLVRKSSLGPEAASHPSDYLTMEEVQKLREGNAWQPIDNTPELDLPDDLLPRRAAFATGGRVSMIHPAAAIQPLVRVPGFDRF